MAFTDDDCTPRRDWLAGLAGILVGSSEAICGAGGPAVLDDPRGIVLRYLHGANPLQPLEQELSTSGWPGRLLRYARANLASPSELTGRRVVLSLVGANMGFRREVLERVDGFDERITFGGDEEDLCLRIRREYGDHSLVFDAAVGVGHRFVGTVPDIVRRARGYGRGHARRLLKHGGLPPVLPFPILVGVAIGLGLASRPRLLAAGLGAPVILYGRGWRRRGPATDRLVHPYIRLLQELSTMFGFVEGWLRYRPAYRAARQAVAQDSTR